MMDRNEKLLQHIKSLVNDLIVYCDRDEELQKDVIEDGLKGIRNVINLELNE